MNGRRRVLILSWRDIGHPDAGGSETYLHEIFSRIGKDHEVTYLSARAPGLPGREIRDGIMYIRVGGRLSVIPLALLTVLRHRRHWDVVVDVINGLPFATPLVRRRGILALTHHVHHEQWRMVYPDWRGRLGWFVESRLCPVLYRARPTVTVSDASRKDLLRLGFDPSRVTVVRNALSPSRTTIWPLPSAQPRLVCLGRLVPHKRIEHALQVVAELRSDLPEVALDIIGGGYWREPLQAYAAALGISDNVLFHGHVSDAARDAVLARAWVHLFPSVKEGWGLAVTEAGAFDVPSVAYRSAGGVRESIDHGRSGLLVEDLSELCDATRTLLTDHELRTRLGAAASAKASSRSWNDAAREMAIALAAATQRSP